MSVRERLERIGPRAVFGWGLVVAGVLACLQLRDYFWGLLVSFVVVTAGAVVLLLPPALRLWSDNWWRFGRRPADPDATEAADGTPTAIVHNSYSRRYFSQISKERRRELLTDLLTKAELLPTFRPDRAKNVWEAFHGEALMILEKLYEQSDEKYIGFARVDLVHHAIGWDSNEVWQMGRQSYIDRIKIMLRELDLFGDSH